MRTPDEGRDSPFGHYTREEIRLIERLVRPFYLKMHLVEAPIEADPQVAGRFRRKLVRVGGKVTSEQVEWLLQGNGWRELTMGAWFALAVPTEEVREAVVVAWNNVTGAHAAGPLATVSALIVGPDAIEGMRSFVERLDGREDRGTAWYVSATIAHLGGSPSSDPDPTVVATFRESLRIATDLRSDFRAARRPR
ncbi:DUF6000 family protein [Myceligenerans salitolerans]|uniref:Uncharacterized protein n=1 Tax=Myceligenerans salitolerans TaxID=1230528 RepID=A0ABS3I7Y7_9MICO|nr:DUF6000 family protein [Myceligenerans salitolerans]MBO0609116.1 hypothetical protein [Myceligenerans salitolerans]